MLAELDSTFRVGGVPGGGGGAGGSIASSTRLSTADECEFDELSDASDGKGGPPSFGFNTPRSRISIAGVPSRTVGVTVGSGIDGTGAVSKAATAASRASRLAIIPLTCDLIL